MGSILLIDDSLYAKDLLRRFLTAGGHEIAGEAADGLDGIELYSKLKPDLVILDMIMPRLNGLETLRAIRRSDPDAKVLIISADGQEEHVSDMAKEGVSGYIVKPYSKQTVLNEVDAIIGPAPRGG